MPAPAWPGSCYKYVGSALSEAARVEYWVSCLKYNTRIPSSLEWRSVPVRPPS